MKKTFENYDKLTAGDVIKDKLKVFGLGIAGSIVCAIPYFVLLQFNVSSIALFILSGIGAMIFYAVFGKKDGRNVWDHLILIASTLIGSFIAFCTAYITHYAPLWTLEGHEDFSNFQKLWFALSHARVDYFEKGKLITDGGSFSIWTTLIAAFVFAIIGMYIAFIFVLISNNDKKKGKK